jgi:2-keto-3-deoxy-L-fuconate dehydrogenase
VILLSKQITTDYLAEGIVANAICPTGVDTPFIERRFAQEGDPVAARARYEEVVGPLLKPEEIARVALFLVTDGLAHFPVPYIQ